MTTHGPTNHHEQQKPLRERLLNETDPLIRKLLICELNRLCKLENQHLVSRSLALDRISRSHPTTHNRQAIPCGLRHSRESPGFKPDEHWSFLSDTDKRAKRHQRIATEFLTAFGIPASGELVEKLVQWGNLNKALASKNVDVYLTLPESVRKAKAKEILTLVQQSFLN